MCQGHSVGCGASASGAKVWPGRLSLGLNESSSTRKVQELLRMIGGLGLVFINHR